MNFWKMEGTGNDFIIIDYLNNTVQNPISDYHNAARKICDRHFGIGGDGLLLVLPPSDRKNDFKMRIFNADGSEAEMCGNGIRCFTHYLSQKKLSSTKKINVETKAGLIRPKLIKKEKNYALIKVNMGKPVFSPEKIPVNLEGFSQNKVTDYPLIIKPENKQYNINCISMGNPHTVIFKEEVDNINLKKWGPKIEQMDIFPQNTNVEFVQVINRQEIKMRVWERGSGITLACGTGACAAVVAGINKKLLANNVKVQLPGGNLFIEWKRQKDSPVQMTGPSHIVFKGSFNKDYLLQNDINIK